MKITEKKLKETIREAVGELMKESVGFDPSPVDKVAVWEAVVETVPQYAEIGIQWDEEGIVIAPIGESYEGDRTWVVIAEPFDAPAGGWFVYEVGGPMEGEVEFDVDNVGLKAAKDEYFGPRDVGYEGW